MLYIYFLWIAFQVFELIFLYTVIKWENLNTNMFAGLVTVLSMSFLSNFIISVGPFTLIVLIGLFRVMFFLAFAKDIYEFHFDFENYLKKEYKPFETDKKFSKLYNKKKKKIDDLQKLKKENLLIKKEENKIEKLNFRLEQLERLKERSEK